ncbi:ScbA/BarX family gamma-butyrolactone biosynthesis protein [Pseudoclavibacter sp. AY1F1]|uniref:ScbA/BarX family gamma-butyrolactone biosynthesis protein n=1 Tax=Pseudoclavibacter sp. AY1F1 TaxID=2080583 RepID=UPI0011B0E26A
MNRELVHRASTSEVLPTSFSDTSKGTFVAGIQWPRRHSFYGPERFDSALIAETIRQLTVLTLHEGYRVPLEHKFMMTGFGFQIHGVQPSVVRRAAAVELVGFVSLVDARWSGTDLRGGKVEVAIRTREGQLIAEGYGVARICSASTYARIRRQGLGDSLGKTQRLEKLPASDVGRQHASDVMIGRTSDPAIHSIQADLDQPYFFDHALDHVPGVALIEAIRQHACIQHANPHVDLQRFEATFTRVVEHSPSATVHASPHSENLFLITQGPAVCVRATATLRVFGPTQVSRKFPSSVKGGAQPAPGALLLE